MTICADQLLGWIRRSDSMDGPGGKELAAAASTTVGQQMSEEVHSKIQQESGVFQMAAP